MTNENSAWWDEVEERRAALSSAQGLRNETDDRLRELEIGEAPLSAQLKGKQGGGLGQQAPMMPPMMMGGAGGRAAGGAAPTAAAGTAPAPVTGPGPAAPMPALPKVTPVAPAATTPQPGGGVPPATASVPGVPAATSAPTAPVAAPAVAQGPQAADAAATSGAAPAAHPASAPSASQPVENARTALSAELGLTPAPRAEAGTQAAPVAAPAGYTVDPAKMLETATRWDEMGRQAEQLSRDVDTMQTNFGLLKTAEDPHRQLVSNASSWSSGASQEFDSLNGKLVDAGLSYIQAEEASRLEAGKVV